ncbi:hypothetical protein SAMN04487894_101591 [Niabella drilacis]|uniref:Uncharacterized protein n=2 Tax=Niabella drilacis (strain DSM 25811 / CCM 8410 / CCUG 62505 / LMG 26954 / E90) TaxID=1285928 RepID=A0A1G6JPE1_NIADE|nr:hypothetical protein SAMN04487894_101591 [Niabella drilacis]
MLFLSCFATVMLYGQQDTAYRNRVEHFIAQIERSPALIKHTVKQKDGTCHYWLYKSRLFKIEKHGSEKTPENHIIEKDYQYYLDRGKLIRAYERELLLVNGNREDVNVWSATTYFKSNRLRYITSLGHGKTEDEEYDMEKETLKYFQELKTLLQLQ